MIIDFHTHVFPDKIADAAINALASASSTTPFSNGKISGLISRLDEAGVDLAVNLPVLTKPSQYDSVLRFALSINETNDRIISFAGFHPQQGDVKNKMKELKRLGVKGIKIHPDYQGTFFDADDYVEIVKSAKDNDLIVVTHAGFDQGFPGQPVKCTPDRVLKLLEKVGGYDKLVLAHFGGNESFDEVYDKLAGKNILFDTAYILSKTSEAQFKKTLEKHGGDKILFASDSPWSNIAADVAKIKGFSLSPETEEKILYKNAKHLLSI